MGGVCICLFLGKIRSHLPKCGKLVFVTSCHNHNITLFAASMVVSYRFTALYVFLLNLSISTYNADWKVC